MRRRVLMLIAALLGVVIQAQTPTFVLSPPWFARSLGEKKALVVLMKFTTTTPSADAARVGSAKNALSIMTTRLTQHSIGQLQFSGDVYGPLLVPYSEDGCGSVVTRAAQNLLDAAGVSWRTYDTRYWVSEGKFGCLGHFRYLTPQDAVMYGFGNQWGLWAWFRQRMQKDSSLECGTSMSLNLTGLNCKWPLLPGAGNPFSAYGREANSSTLSLGNRRRLGWFSQPGGPYLTEVTQSGAYAIAASNIPFDGRPQGLSIFVGNDWNGHPRWIHVDRRAAVGNDAWLATSTWATRVRDGVILTWDTGYNTSTPPGNLLLDTLPSTTTENDAGLPLGEPWTYPNGPRITVVSVGATEAVVDVQIP